MSEDLLITPEQAAEEILLRRKARADLLSFVKYTMPTYSVGAHHKAICDALMRIVRGDNKRLMIFAPPRSGKSEISSRRLPPFLFGIDPSTQVILASYGQELANDFGRDMRSIIQSDLYQNLFQSRIRYDSKATNRFHVTSNKMQKDGTMFAVGVGSSATGRGASIVIIDDICKNREDADSGIVRQKIWDWYTSTLYTRLMPGGKIVVLLTRWHEDDLAGRLLDAQEKGGEKWEVISLPAIKTELGIEKALWPEWYPLDDLHRIRKTIGPRDWSALYMQTPRPDSGTFFEREWFNRVDISEMPKTLNRYITSDFAVTDGRGDFTEHAVWGIDKDDNMFAVDWWYGQASSDKWIAAQLDLIRKHKPLCWFGESGVIKRALEGIILKSMRDEKTYCRTEWVTSATDKATRARAFQARAAMKKVYIPKTPWGDRLIDQLVSFPAGKNDDAVDVCSLIASVIDQAHPAIVPIPVRLEVRDSWSKDNGDNNRWRVV